MKNHEKLKNLTHSLLQEIGEDPGREGLLKTPSRVAKSWKYFSQGYDQDMEDIINFPENSGIPEDLQHEVKVTGKYMLRALLEFQVWYDTKILFCGNKDNAFLVTNSIFKRVSQLVHAEKNQ